MSTSDTIVVKPLVYNGSLTTYAPWRRSLALYMAVSISKFPGDNSKIAYTLHDRGYSQHLGTGLLRGEE